MVGGPSIIFHRYHEKGVTTLREPNGKTAAKLVGFDANALYLWRLMQEMPTEHPTRRRKENGFKAEKIDYYGQMSREWLEWTMHTQDIQLQHKFNGRRHIPVDGWDPINQTAYQFHGCLWHGHSCYKTRGKTLNEVNGKPLNELQANTAQITQYLRD